MQLLSVLFRYLSPLQSILTGDRHNAIPPTITFSHDWHVLGPFSVGTRTWNWGADPLEATGGFHQLCKDNSTYKSSLGKDGTIGWSTSTADIKYSDIHIGEAQLQISFPDIDWHFLQQIYGWAALQWQGWARGQIFVNANNTILVNLLAEHISELWIDDTHYYGGDFYALNKAVMKISLAPGMHNIDLRLIRDVRSMGGITDNPALDIHLRLSQSKPALHQAGQVLYPDRLDDWQGPMSSSYASVVLRNDHDTDVFIHSLRAKHNQCLAEFLDAAPIKVAPGQSRAVGFEVGCISGTSAYLSVDLHFGYQTENGGEHSLFVGILAAEPVSRHKPHMITYLHPSGIVSHGILKPPPLSTKCLKSKKLPVLVALHGAGVDVSSEEARHVLDGASDLCAWVVIPSGVTAWSGDDWHSWGFGDVEAAVAAIPDWITSVAWDGPGVDTSHWLVAGHSNGGQGTWYAVTHHPDRVIAAAPLSGYSSIQNYVPYTFWQPADSRRIAVIQAQLDSYRHELLLENIRGIPLLLQHGSLDDNVPTYHSRFMHEQLRSHDIDSNYVECPGMPHYWTGVMTTPELTAFYEAHIDAYNEGQRTLLKDFSLVTGNPGITGSKMGVQILALIDPGQLGRLQVSFGHGDMPVCSMLTRNIEGLDLQSELLQHCRSLQVDEHMISLKHTSSGIRLRRSRDNAWTIDHDDAHSRHLRTLRQQGGLEAILRSAGTFQIAQHSSGTQHAATQIANNLLQYYSANVNLAQSYQDAMMARGNIISIALGQDLPSMSASPSQCAFAFGENEMIVRKDSKLLQSHAYAEDDIVAAAYLQPLPDDRLELVFWAVNASYLSACTRLLPIITGGGQPDFVIVTSKMLQNGVDGVLDMGFLDSHWCPTPSSFFSTST